MKTIEHFLSVLGSRDIVLRAEGDRLKVNAPKGAMTPDLAGSIRERKNEILEFLKRINAEQEKIPRAPEDRPPVLSFAQQRMWFLDQLEGHGGGTATSGSHYNIPIALSLTGSLDHRTLERAVDEIVARHSSVRATFADDKGSPLLVVRPARRETIPVVDLSGMADADGLARRLVAREAARPFDLATGPLLRLNLVRTDGSTHLLSTVMHHIVSDGWSCGVLVRELTALYGFYLSHPHGTASPLPPLDIQYTDFAHWQQDWFTDSQREMQIAYWQKKLEGIAGLHQIPTDKPRPRVLSYRGAAHGFRVGAAVTAPLKALAKRTGSSLFMLLEAGFAVLLHRYSGDTDLCIGSPVANRNRKDIEPLIGLFVNTLVLRNDLSGSPTFLRFLERVKLTALEAYRHQDIPFEQVVDALQPERNLSYSPIFQVMFTMANTPVSKLTLPGLKLGPVGTGLEMAKFDLNLSMNEAGDGLSCSLEYSSDLFEAATIRRMTGHLTRLLASVGEDPERRIAHLTMLDTEERALLVETWNATETPFPNTACCHRRFEARARQIPDSAALVDRDRWLTFAALDAWSDRLAATLRHEGVGPWTRVGLLVERSAEMIAGLYGILKAGGAYVPIDPTYPRERIAFMLSDSSAPVLFTKRAWRESLPREAGRVFFLDEPLSLPPMTPGASKNELGHLIYIIYTSGSTGRPKGAGVTHGSFANLVNWFIRDFELDDRDRVLLTSSVSFDLTQKNLYTTLVTGGVLHLAPASPYDPRRINEMVSERGITWLNCTPSAFYPLIEDGGDDHALRLRSLRWVFLGGEPISIARLEPWLKAAATGAVVVNTYGPTECTDISNFNPMVRPLDFLNKPTPIGRAVANVKLLILDRHLGLTPLGGMGELCIFGQSVGPGYLTDPGLSAQKFVPNPYGARPGDRLYRTGDLTRYEADHETPDRGSVTFIGRVDHQIKVRGFRIELGEIEAALTAIPETREAVVLIRETREGDRDTRSEKQIAAYLQLEEGASTPDFHGLLRESLPDYMVPHAFVVLETFPLTPSGKIDRIALSRIEPGGNALAAASEAEVFAAPETPMEEQVAEVFADILGRDAVSVTASFFRMGGHSLLATRVVSRLREVFQADLPLQAIFEEPTVRGLSALLAAADTAAHLPALVPVPRDGKNGGRGLPLSFSQERLWFLYQLEGPSSTYNMPTAVRLTGPLAAEILAECAAEVVRRHEVLRTSFAPDGDRAVQIVHPPQKPPLPLIDLSILEEDRRGSLAEKTIERAALVPFALESVPLLRLLLIRTAPHAHILLVNMHHIVSDGWSLSIFTNELTLLYREWSLGRQARGDASFLPELRVQYADFAHWQRQWLSGEVMEAQLAYWRGQLGTPPAPLAMPTDHVRPAVRTFNGGGHHLALSQSLRTDLSRFCQAENATLFMSLLSALAVLLGRWSDQDDLTVGTPIAGRNHAETEPLIGFFLNTLVLRIDLSGRPTFRELLAKVRRLTLDAYRHQDVPFEKLLEVLNPERDLSRTPLFQVFLNMLNLPEADSGTDGLAVEPHGTAEIGAKFDITLYVSEPPRGLSLFLHYNADLYEHARMRAFLDQFALVLEQACQAPDRPVNGYSLITRAARGLLPDPTTPLDGGWLGAVPQLMEREAARVPQRQAVVGPDRSFSYRELADRANRVAALLACQGVGRGDRVAIYAARDPSLVVAVMGALKAGAAFVMLDPAYPAARQRHYLEPTAPRALLALESTGEVPPDLETAIEDIPVRLTIPADGIVPSSKGEEAAMPPDIALGPDDLAYVAFTSGSTGKPKGILGRHGPLTHFLPWLVRTFGFGEKDRFSMLSGLSHDPLQRDIFTPLCLGASVWTPAADEIGPGTLAAWMHRARITVSHLTPAMARILTEGARPREGHALRLAFVTGDVLTRRDVTRLREMAPGLRVVNFYGSTETQRAVGYMEISDTAGTDSGGKEVMPLGRGIEDVQLLVLNTEGAQAGIGEIGEIHVRSPHLAAGYLNEPEMSLARFPANPFTAKDGAESSADRMYRTGDLGYLRPDGLLVFSGRADRQVKLRGFRIELGEIEGALAKHRQVREAAVIALGGEDGDARLAAFVQTEHGQDPQLEPLLRRHLKALLPGFMVPALIVPLRELPVTPNLKLDRTALARIAAERSESLAELAAVGATAPRTPTEELLAGIWAEVLGKPDGAIGVHRDFFDLGGHSLLATRVVSRVARVFGVTLPLRTMFEATTIAGLASLVEAMQRETPSRPLVPKPRTGEVLPLSFAQQRLWFLDRLEGPNAAYNMPFSLRLKGPLRVEGLQRCLDKITERHEVLRTRFREEDGQSLLIVDEPGPLELPVVALGGLPEAEDLAERLASGEAARVFDLETDRLLRASLLRLDMETHLLLVTMHHIVSDGWSLGIMVRELFALYADPNADLPPLPVQYADFAAWQREWLQGEVLDRQLEYWQRQLAGAPALLDLPTDRPRPPVQTYGGDRVPVSFPPALVTSLAALGRARGATRFMVLEAGFALLLSRYSGSRDIVVGTPVANRTRAEIEPLIGFFINTLVLRNDLSGRPSFNVLLDRVRQTALDAYAHQEVPFEQVIDAVQPERNLGFSPLFQVMLVYQNLPVRDVAAAEIAVTAMPIKNTTAKFDLTLTLSDSGSGDRGLAGMLEFNSELFEKATVEAMIRHFRTLLEALAESPDRPAIELNLLDDGERQRLLTAWSGSGIEAPGFVPVHRGFEATTTAMPDSVALVGQNGERLDYRTANRKVNRLARYLSERGAGPETQVGVLMRRSPELVTALLAVLKTGAAYVPLDPAYPAERLSFILGDAGIRVVVTDVEASELLSDEVTVVRPQSSAEGPAANPETAPEPDHPSHLIYTSGSTGIPKGVAIRHGGTAALLAWARETFPRPSLEAVLAATSVCFDLSVFEIFTPLTAGGRVIVAENALTLPDHPAKNEVTLINTVPSAMTELVSLNQIPPLVSIVNLAGEPLRRELVESLYAFKPIRAVYNLYGPSEDTTYSTGARAVAGDPGQPTIGKAVSGTAAYVLDPRMNLLPAGLRGGLYLAGEGLARGYWNRPHLTAERFVPNPFADHGHAGSRLYVTGDRVRFLPDGQLAFLGRTDHQIKLRGFRIELGEIEAVLGEHGEVTNAAVLVHENRLIAFVETALDRDQPLRDFLGARLPAHMVPSVWLLKRSLPLTPNGKIDRKSLNREAGNIGKAPSGQGPAVPPQTDRERLLYRIWAETLGLESIGVDDNFFEIGGDSILSIRIVARARQHGLHFTPKDMFRHQTIRALATYAGTTKARNVDADQGTISGPVDLTPIQRWFLDRDDPAPAHFNQAMLFSLPTDTDPGLLERAFSAIIRHHDALRLGFRKEPDGWSAENRRKTDFVLETHDVSHASDPGQALEETAGRIQAGLDLEKGRLLRAAWFTGCPETTPGKSARLLIAIHHLAVDGVSWRILLEDLQSAYAALSRGAPVALPPKTTAYQAWSRRLSALAASPELEREAAWWRRFLATRTAGRVPDDFALDGQRDTHADTASLSVLLDETRTELLLGEANRAYRTHTDELLLTVLMETFTAKFGGRSLALDLEGHGREDLFDDMDLSRTVGWFTALFPVRLTLARETDRAANLKRVKETLRRIPRKGIGYGLLRYLKPMPELEAGSSVLFNYLGQIRETATGPSLFESAPEATGPRRSPIGLRSHALEINAIAAGGRLRVDWSFSRKRHRASTIRDLAQAFKTGLETLIDHCVIPEAGGFTPSDFPLARIGQDRLARLLQGRREVEDLYPLSPMQGGMLFHALADRDRAAYLEQLACTIHGPLDTARFREAWAQTLRRHSVLRTSFHWRGLTLPLQMVHREVDLPWHEEDWREWKEKSAAMVTKLQEEDHHRAFDLETPPLMRFHLVRLADQEYRFLWCFHHVLLDGWSVSVLLREVFALYGHTGDARQALPQPEPYAVYIRWLSGRDMASAKRFWRETLAGFTRAMPLPHAVGDSGAGEAGLWTKLLSREETQTLERFARECRLTLNTLVQAAWAMVLGLHSGREDVLFGATVAGRSADLPGIDSMVGLFINTLPVRVRLERTRALKDWLHSLQEAQLDRERFAYLPLADIGSLAELPKGQALFETNLVFENYPLGTGLQSQSDDSLRITEVAHGEVVNFPLSVMAIPGPLLNFKLRFDKARLAPAAVAAMGRDFIGFLMKFPDLGNRPMGLVDPLTEEDSRRLVTAFNRTDERVAEDLIPRFLRFARQRPDQVALCAAGDQCAAFTYGSLERITADLAERIALHSGTVVAIWAARTPSTVIAMIGVMRAGRAFLPLDPDFPPERRAWILSNSGARMLVGHSGMAADMEEFNAEVLYLDKPVSRHERPSLESRIDRVPHPQEPAYAIYTSGSTGLPKGVCVGRGAIANYVQGLLERLQADPGRGFGLVSTPAADLGFTSVFGALGSGGCLHVFSRNRVMSPASFASYTASAPLDYLKITPSHVGALLVGDDAAPVLPREALILGGETASAELLHRIRRLRPDLLILNHYGPTEATVGLLTHPLKPDDPIPLDGNLPLGTPISNMRTYTLTRHGRLCPIGVAGELYCGGAGLAQGYLGRPDTTAASFGPDPFGRVPGGRLYRTGDLTGMTESGLRRFLGRIDHQIKLRGYRIEPGEIENGLKSLDQVANAVVLLDRASEGTARLVAFIEPAVNGVTGETVKAALRRKLPEYMIPSECIFLDRIPLTPNGKIDRAALWRQEKTYKGLKERNHVAPRNEDELRMTLLWEEVLGTGPVGPEDNFFVLGGHSLLAMRLLARVEERFGSSLAFLDFFASPTPAGLLSRLSRSGETRTASPLVRLRGSGSKTPLFLVHAAGGTVLSYRSLVRYLDPDRPVHAFQSPGLLAGRNALSDIETMALVYNEALQAVQPEGPYLLGGWSMGGPIAFQMARLLKDQGHEVGGILLLDSFPTSARFRLRELGEAEILVDFMTTLGGAVRLTVEELEPLSEDRRLALILERAADAGLLPPETELRQFQTMWSVYKANRLAADRFEPGSWPGEVQLFRAETRDSRFADDPMNGWREHAAEVRVISVRGDHNSILHEPNVAGLAREIDKVLGSW